MSERAQRAKENFLKGYNCCQAVIEVFAEDFGFDKLACLKLAEGFGGGMGRMRLTCGAVSAMAIVASMKISHGTAGDLKTRGELYAVIQRMANGFKENNGSVICAELLGAALPKYNSPTPEARTAEYYARRPCPDKIYQCAELIEKYLF